jgi:FAD:protein FMN transferase
MAAELRFRAMGSDVHLCVVGGRPGLLDQARQRIYDLERLWSRFLPESEISQLTVYAGHVVVVSPETLELVERAIDAWRLTEGTFDPTVLGSVIRAGYHRSFEGLDGAGHSSLTFGCGDIDILGPAVRLPAGTGFDPGGIGKGLAADIVTREVMAAGAQGVCVNVGGDLRVAGVNPFGAAWTIDIEAPESALSLTRIGLAAGAVATSTTNRRRWVVDGERRHHVIDPSTGLPSSSDLVQVSVIAPTGWLAEVLAKTVLVRGSFRGFAFLDEFGTDALGVDIHGDTITTKGFGAFTGGMAVLEHVAVTP